MNLKEFWEYRIANKHWWKRIWYTHVASRINPRSKWLTKHIPRVWADKDYIIETAVFQSLIHFWEPEGEDGESVLRYQFEGDHITEYDSEHLLQLRLMHHELKEAYEWAKIRDKKFEDFTSFENEAKLIEIDTGHLLNIIKYRKYLWT